jgi:hypothetical protein
MHLDVAMARASGDTVCLECTDGDWQPGNCAAEWHEAEGTGNEGGIPHNPQSPCAQGYCWDKHPINPLCSEEEEDSDSPAIPIGELPHVVETLGNAPPRDLPGMMKELGGRVRYVALRRAVQITGCDGLVIAHIPLSSRQAEELASAG